MKVMMNKEQFLGSGIIEQYVLGLTTQEESEMVEQFIKSHPELKKEIDILQEALHQYALEQAVPPPEHLKGKIIDEIDVHLVEEQLKKANTNAVKSVRNTRSNWFVLAMALGTLFIGFLAFSYYQQANNEQASRINLQQELEALKIACANEAQQKEAVEKLYAQITDKNTLPIALNSTLNSSQTEAVIYWNPTQQSAFINPALLPAPPDGHQYQVWADVEGVMINAGLVDLSQDSIQLLTYIAEAESLNITIEPLGGSDHPTVERLIANAKV